MNINPMSDHDYLCYGEVVLMPEGYFEAYQMQQEVFNHTEIPLTAAQEKDNQQALAVLNSTEVAADGEWTQQAA